MKVIGKILIITFLWMAWAMRDAIAEPESDGLTGYEGEVSAFELHEKKVLEEKSKEHKYKFKGFSSYRPDFAKMCALIDQDGQIDWINVVAQRYAFEATECLPCRTLYLSLNSTCKIKKKYVSKLKPKIKEGGETAEGEGTPTPVPTPKEEGRKSPKLDPSTELIDYVCNLFREMAEKTPPEEAQNYYTGISHLITEMRKTEGKTVSQREYFDTLAEYIESPFKAEGFLNSTKNSVNSGKLVPITRPGTSLDDLF